MTQLASVLAQVLHSTTFRTKEGRVHSAEELQQALPRTWGHVSETRDVMSAYPEVEDDCLDAVATHLRARLSEYIDVGTDSIGHSFDVVDDSGRYFRRTPDGAVETHSSSQLPGFARGLIRAAAILGPDRAAQLLGLWADGEPRRYKICVVLAGVYVDKGIELSQGLRVYGLPISSD